MQVELTSEQEKLVNDWIEAGAYGSAQEVIADALARLVEDEIVAGHDQDELRASLRRSREQFDRGEGKPWDVGDFIARGEKRLAERSPTKARA